MSGVTVIGPIGKQTHDDYLTELIHKVWRGDGDRADLGSFPLTPLSELKLIAIGELYRLEQWDASKEYDKNGARLITSTYNLPESVYHDLEMTNYGVAPFVPHLFPVLDSFSVVGKLDDTRVGLDLYFFPGNIQPTGTRAFVQSSQKNLAERLSLARELSPEIFCFGNVEGESAYTKRSVGRKTIDLVPYGIKGNVFREEIKIRCSVCEGELKFGLEKGKQYNEIVLEMMGFVSQHPHFNPERYILRHYDFKIDFGPEVGKAEFSRKYDELMKRVQRVFEKKVQRYAA